MIWNFTIAVPFDLDQPRVIKTPCTKDTVQEDPDPRSPLYCYPCFCKKLRQQLSRSEQEAPEPSSEQAWSWWRTSKYSELERLQAFLKHEMCSSEEICTHFDKVCYLTKSDVVCLFLK